MSSLHGSIELENEHLRLLAEIDFLVRHDYRFINNSILIKREIENVIGNMTWK